MRLVSLENAIGRMSMRERTITAQVLVTSEQPILHALARALIAANAVEAAQLAEIETDIVRDRIAQADAESADLPEPPAYRP